MPLPRSTALLVPLFSARSKRQAGIGDMGDVASLADFAAACGASAIQLLPLCEPVGGDASPYAAKSAFAIDPLLIALDRVEDLGGAGWESALPADLRTILDSARASTRIDYAAVREVKRGALGVAHERFREREWARWTARAAAFQRFCDEHADWLDDYALYAAIEETQRGAWWRDWPEPLRDRHPHALAERRAALEPRVSLFRYAQWTADAQWADARAAAAARKVRLSGDLPFMVSTSSGDVWAHRGLFRLDATVGAPPDALAPGGQDWGLPPYRWDVFAGNDDAWLRARARRAAALFDLYRVDHVVGFFRTYVIPDGVEKKKGHFSPGHEHEQRAQGARVLRAMQSAGAGVIAEDLGTIPPFVRETMAALEIPGYKVMRWERAWGAPGQPFLEPSSYAPCSVATSGTHDTTTLSVWWETETSDDERRAVAALAPMAAARAAIEGGERACTSAVHAALLETLCAAGSSLLILPVQDLFGWRDQVNVPGTVGAGNWSWRMPFDLDAPLPEPLRGPVERFAEAARRYGRGR